MEGEAGRKAHSERKECAFPMIVRNIKLLHGAGEPVTLNKRKKTRKERIFKTCIRMWLT